MPWHAYNAAGGVLNLTLARVFYFFVLFLFPWLKNFFCCRFNWWLRSDHSYIHKWRASPFLPGWKRIQCANCLLWHLLAFGKGRPKHNLSRRCVITGQFIWFFSYFASGRGILMWQFMHGRCRVTVWPERRLSQSVFRLATERGSVSVCFQLMRRANQRRCCFFFFVDGIKYAVTTSSSRHDIIVPFLNSAKL